MITSIHPTPGHHTDREAAEDLTVEEVTQAALVPPSILAAMRARRGPPMYRRLTELRLLQPFLALAIPYP